MKSGKFSQKYIYKTTFPYEWKSSHIHDKTENEVLQNI